LVHIVVFISGRRIMHGKCDDIPKPEYGHKREIGVLRPFLSHPTERERAEACLEYVRRGEEEGDESWHRGPIQMTQLVGETVAREY